MVKTSYGDVSDSYRDEWNKLYFGNLFCTLTENFCTALVTFNVNVYLSVVLPSLEIASVMHEKSILPIINFMTT